MCVHSLLLAALSCVPRVHAHTQKPGHRARSPHTTHTLLPTLRPSPTHADACLTGWDMAHIVHQYRPRAASLAYMCGRMPYRLGHGAHSPPVPSPRCVPRLHARTHALQAGTWRT